MNTHLVRTLALAIATIAVGARGQNLLLNPSFEEPAVAGLTLVSLGNTVGSGWTVINSGLVQAAPATLAPAGALSNRWPAAADGTQQLGLFDWTAPFFRAAIQQSVTNTPVTGQEYEFTFALGRYAPTNSHLPGNAAVFVSIYSSTGDGFATGQLFSVSGPLQFQTQSMRFTTEVTGGFVVRFDQYQGYPTLDAVSLRPVPEPTAGAFIAAAVGGWFVVCVRRKIRRNSFTSPPPR